MSDSFENASPARRGRSKGRQAYDGGDRLDRLPPHSPEAEVGTLSCMFQEHNDEAINQAEELGVSEHWFYDIRHQLIWKAVTELRNGGKTIDPITCLQWLKDRNLLEQVGGVDYIARLPDLVPSAAGAPYYLEILRDQLLLREVIKAGTAAVADAYSIVEGEKTDPEQLIARLETAIGRLSETSSTVSEIRIDQVVGAIMPELEDYHRGRAQIKGLPTNLEYLDKLLCGMGGPNGNYVVFSGRPSTGKTSLALQIADYVANDFVWWDPVLAPGPGGVLAPVMDADGKAEHKRQVGVPVGIFSYEMATEALVMRMLFNRANADLQRWRTGFAEAGDIEKILQASHVLASSKIYIDDRPGPVESLRARARRMYRQHGIRCFIIDYLQLMKSANARRREDRVQELSDVSAQIAELGKELGVPFIVLAQMNRDYEKEPTRPPRLADLKDCGSIEQDADVVAFLYRARMTREKDKAQYEAAMDIVFPGGDWSKRPERVDVLVAKNRYGPTGKAQLLFQKSCTKFFDWIAWLKDHGQRELAAGESRKSSDSGATPAGNQAPDERERGDFDDSGYSDRE